MQKPGLFNFLSDPRNQYDPHSQVIIRLRDQDGLPIPIGNSDIFFVSNQQEKGTTPIQSLMQDTSVSGVSPNVILFYLRVKNSSAKNRTGWINWRMFMISLSRSRRSNRRRQARTRLFPTC